MDRGISANSMGVKIFINITLITLILYADNSLLQYILMSYLLGTRFNS